MITINKEDISKKKIDSIVNKTAVETLHDFVKVFIGGKGSVSAVLVFIEEDSIGVRIIGGKEVKISFERIDKICFFETANDFRDLAEELYACLGKLVRMQFNLNSKEDGHD